MSGKGHEISVFARVPTSQAGGERWICGDGLAAPLAGGFARSVAD
jgi:hypothetical protein